MEKPKELFNYLSYLGVIIYAKLIPNGKAKLKMHVMFVIALLSLYPMSIHAKNDASVLTLSDAITKALRNNPGIAEIQEKYNALSEIPSQAGSLPDPKLMLNAMNLPSDSFDLKQEPMTQMQIGVGQMFPFPGKLGLKKKASEFEAIAASHSLEEMRLKIANFVAQRWWKLFYFDKSLEIIATNQDLLREFLEVTQTKYKVGNGLQQDVLLAQLELSKLLDMEIQLKNLRRQEEISLNVLMDNPTNERIVLPRNVSENFPELLEESVLLKRSNNNRPSLQAEDAIISAAESRLKLAKRDFLPDVGVSVFYGNRKGLNPPPRNDPRSDFVSIMLNLNIPLYAATKQSKHVAQRQAELRKFKYAEQDEKGKVHAEISAAVADYNKYKEQYSLFKTGIIPQAQQTVSSMSSGYQVNKVDFLNLIRSQITLFNYEMQYWVAFTNAQRAVARLVAAVGGGSIYE